MKVLVVDDNRLLATTIQEILEDDGLEVMSAGDGIDGYSAYLSFQPDMIITDIQMPRKTGLEMMKHDQDHLYEWRFGLFSAAPQRGKEAISDQFF
jgi:CheY-like chemotaxis protein